MEREEMLSWDVVGSVSYTPSRKQVRVLVEVLCVEGDGKRVKDVERALLRQPQAAWASAVRALGEVTQPSEQVGKRGRLCKLLGRLLDEQGVGDVGPLLAALRDGEEGVRRASARALGKRWRAGDEERGVIEGALLEALTQEAQSGVEAALVEALGRVGGLRSQAALATRQGQAAEDARLLLRRNLSARAVGGGVAEGGGGGAAEGGIGGGVAGAVRVEGAVRDDVSVGEAMTWTWRCRSGLEQVLAAELAAVGVGQPIKVGRGEVSGRLGAEAALGWGWRSRVATGFGLSLRLGALGEGLGDGLVRALSSAQVEGVLRRVAADGDAPVRYRLSAASEGGVVAAREGGPREGGRGKALTRGLLQEVVKRLVERAPWLVNDPSLRGWEVEARAGDGVGGGVGVWLSPRLVDPRFVYRRGDVPAASHPTMAAALALIAAPRAGDVIWDPFAGSGGEVIECGLRAGGAVTLVGSDLSQGALDTAAQNAAAANLTVTWRVADALRWCPQPRPTLIVTNPPMGRRVKLADGLDAFFAQCLEAFARALAPGGRLVWFAPRGRAVAAAARRGGWRLSVDQPVDMGGFEVHLQALTAPSG